MTDHQPDSTSPAASNGSAGAEGENNAMDGATTGDAATPPQANGHASKKIRPLPPYARSDVADALAEITDRLRTPASELPPAEWEVLDYPFRERFPSLFVRNMTVIARLVIGWLWLPLIGIGSFVALIWSYQLAERAQAGKGTTVTAHWFGPDFSLTPTTAVLFAMAFAACAGSVVQASVVFAIRAGKHTLESGYEAWYFLRPVTSLLLGPLFGLATIGGLAAITTGSGSAAQLSLPALVTAGALAGLFTDRVLQQMQQILGATDPDRHTAFQDTPGTPTAPSDPSGAPNKDPNGTGPTAGAPRVPDQRQKGSLKAEAGRSGKPKKPVKVQITATTQPQKKGNGKKGSRTAKSAPTHAAKSGK